MEQSYPYDDEFQTSLLVLMAKDPQFLPIHADLVKPEYFFSEPAHILSSILLDHYIEYGTPPEYTAAKRGVFDYLQAVKLDSEVATQLNDLVRNVYRMQLSEVPPDVAPRTIEFGKQRVLQAIAYQMGDMLKAGAPSDEILQVMNEFQHQAVPIGSEPQDLGNDLLHGLDIVRASTIFSAQAKISTGFPTLDRMMNGGIGRRQLMAIMGFTNIGKSMFLVNLGHAALEQRLPVVHVSIGEMEYEDMLVRYGARITGLEANELTSNSDAVKEEYERRMAEKVDLWGPVLRFKYFAPYTSVSSIRALLSRIKFREGISPALVLVDNADELSSSKASQEKYDEQGYVYTELKQMAHDFDCAVIADTQTNRLGGKARVADMDLMGESHRKNKKLDGLFSLNQTFEEAIAGVMRIHAIKGRRFSKSLDDICYCAVEKSIMTVREITVNDPRIANMRNNARGNSNGDSAEA